jgi:hypothetical protein
MQNCEICKGTVDITVTKTKTADGVFVDIIHPDSMCKACRGLYDYYTKTLKMSQQEAKEHLESQFHWLHKQPFTTGRPHYKFVRYSAF